MVRQNSLSIALAVTVKQRRGELNMSREELADAMGVPLEIITDIEDSIPNECLSSKSTLMLLALALRLSDHALAGYSDSSEHSSESALEMAPSEQQVDQRSEEEDAPPARKPLFLPPMFARKPSLETPLIVADDNQQKVHLGLEALPSDRPSRISAYKPKLPKSDALKSRFIPGHAVERTKPVRLSLNKSQQSQSSIEELLRPKAPSPNSESQKETSEKLVPISLMPDSDLAPETESREGQAPQQPVVTRKSYVPSLASRLPFGDLQRETGIFRIENAPAPAPNQKVNAQFATSVPGLSKPSNASQAEQTSESEEKNELLRSTHQPTPSKIHPAQ